MQVYVCNQCKLEKPASHFPLNRMRRRGVAYKCKACYKKYDAQKYLLTREAQISRATEWNSKHQSVRRDNHFRRTYSITLNDYLQMLDNQNGVCAICGKSPTRRALDVDHDKTSGKIRGILCNKHNQGIAHFDHDPKLLLAAVAYLEKYT